MSATETSTETSVSLTRLKRSKILPIYNMDQLIKARAAELGESPLICYPKEGLLDFEEHSARAIDRYTDAAVEKLQGLGLRPIDPEVSTPPVVGILAQSGLNVIITIIGLSRLGYTVFLISTRLATPAIARLLELTNCNTILTTSGFHNTLNEVSKEISLTYLPLLEHEDYSASSAPVFERDYDPEENGKKNAVIIHSSGSTGMPKPIYLTHRSCIGAFAVNMNMRALLTAPLFHSNGFYETFRSIYSKKPIYIGNYSLPLTRESLVKVIETTKPELFHCVPYVVKLLAEKEDGIRALAGVKLVLFAGSSCPDELGDLLVRRGVNLVANYGATETGRLMNSVRPPEDLYWNYLRILPHAQPYTLMDQISPGLYECVALDGLPSKSTTNSDNPPGSFRTRDLFTPHESMSGLWKYVCRLDDRLTLINGEKVLPIAIEGRIRQEQFVKEVVVFGERRSYPGVLIIRADCASHLSAEKFVDAVWPAIEAANAGAETFSRIPKELVVVLPANITYPRTDKGTFIRVPTYQQFERDISHAYDKFENVEAGSIRLSRQDLEDYLLHKLNERFRITLLLEDDFFASGVDSLQCIQIWSLIKKELDLGGHHSKLSQNVLYETGNVSELARHLETLRTGEEVRVEELREIKDLISKYSTFEVHVPGNTPPPEQQTILLTGVTGGLGAHLLAQLVQRRDVSAVWALVRAPTDSAAAERLQQSLLSRGLHLGADESSKVTALACSFGHDGFGLDPLMLARLKRDLTLVIHSAWAVNFNITLKSFEQEHIKALRDMIQLCLSVEHSEPARFFFCSSVSAAGGSPRPGKISESLVANPAHAQATGYGRSKFVAEHIVYNAMAKMGILARVLRVGQLVGDTKIGEWTATEGVPMMIQTACTLGALPKLEEEMTWLPVDYAATIILELIGLSEDEKSFESSKYYSEPGLVYHVLNPRRFHWTREMLPSLAKAGLKFETLSTDEWMDRLRSSERDASKNPPIKLLNWFESKYGLGSSTSEKGNLEYETRETRKASETLGRIPDVTGVGFVSMMIDRLRQHWESPSR